MTSPQRNGAPFVLFCMFANHISLKPRFSLPVSSSPLPLPLSFPCPSPLLPLSYLSTMPLSLLLFLLWLVYYRSSPSPMSLIMYIYIYMRSATPPSRYVPHLSFSFFFYFFFPVTATTSFLFASTLIFYATSLIRLMQIHPQQDDKQCRPLQSLGPFGSACPLIGVLTKYKGGEGEENICMLARTHYP